MKIYVDLKIQQTCEDASLPLNQPVSIHCQRQSTFKALLHHLLAPLRTRPFFLELKAVAFIQTACRIKSPECPQLDGCKPLRITKCHGGIHQTASHTCPAQTIVDDEPAQVCFVVAQILAIYGNRADNSLTLQRQP